MGGDIMAQVWMNKTQKLYGYNGSGRAPRGTTLEQMRERVDEVTSTGFIPTYGEKTLA